jgi:hypothetical protein
MPKIRGTGHGDGHGDGEGDGYGYGHGHGDGYGHGHGDGDGDGSGSGHGNPPTLTSYDASDNTPAAMLVIALMHEAEDIAASRPLAI